MFWILYWYVADYAGQQRGRACFSTSETQKPMELSIVRRISNQQQNLVVCLLKPNQATKASERAFMRSTFSQLTHQYQSQPP